MDSSLLPDHERQRLEALRAYLRLETPSEQAFDDLATLAGYVCEAPIALISLIGEDHLWCKAAVGWPLEDVARELSFSAHAILQRDVFVVQDAMLDPRFAGNPLVTSDPYVRFYAGAPLMTTDGYAVGTLGVMDRVPRGLTASQHGAMTVLSRQVMAQLDVRRGTQELAESEARLRLVTENSRVGLVVVNEAREYAYANNAYADILGLPSPAIIGQRVADVLAEVYETQIRPRLDRAFAGEHVTYELRTTAAGGDRYYVVRYAPTGAAGSGRLVVVVLTDITEPKLAAIAANRLAAIVESSDDAIIGKDLDGVITSWNRGAERIFGYAAGEIVGSPVLRLIPDDRHGEETQILEKIRHGESVTHFETVRRTKTGRLLDVSIASSPIKDADGRIVGASKVARDITGQRTLERQFQQAQKMEAVGRLAGGIAHDFNNLLSVILGYCGLLLDERSADDPVAEDIVQIRKAGTTAAVLTKQLLAFSRKEIIEPTLIDLNVVVSGMHGMLERLIGEDVVIALRLSATPAMVIADSGQTEQIILNLAVNARDAMPLGGRLTIETAHVELDEHYSAAHLAAKPGAYEALSMTDTGTGMTPDVEAHLFEPFFTTKASGKGTGLGLATVHGIVARSGGSIGVYSELGTGTRFTVYLPTADASTAAADPHPHVPHLRGTPRTVLVVEDSDALRELTRRFLVRLGHTALVAANATDALRVFEEHPAIELLLTDVVMPGGSGPDLSRQLLAQAPALKVIFMSGYTEEAIVQHGVLKAGVMLLHKPFTEEALARKMSEALDRDTL